MKEKPIRILLIEDQPDDIQLLEEAFSEIDEARFSRSWMQACQRLYAVTMQEGLELLARQDFDIILLDLTLSEGAGLPTYLEIRGQAPQTPVVVLASEEDEPLALSLIRQGAQAYLIKSELDCLPLARTLRCAVERNRLSVAQQSVSLLDDLTGLYNERGLIHLGERHWRLAERHRLRLLVVLFDLEDLSRIGEALSGQERDIALIQAAETLRDALDETDVIARLSSARFGAVCLVAGAGETAAKLRKLTGLCGSAAVQIGWAASDGEQTASLDQLLRSAERSLCENRQVANRAGRHL